MKSSKPEKLLQKALRNKKVKFKTHHKINKHRVDIFISPNICVEVDGKLFHNFPFGTDKDRRETSWMEMHGYIVLRFWDDEVLNNVDNIVDIIQKNKKNEFFENNLITFTPVKFTFLKNLF